MAGFDNSFWRDIMPTHQQLLKLTEATTNSIVAESLAATQAVSVTGLLDATKHLKGILPAESLTPMWSGAAASLEQALPALWSTELLQAQSAALLASVRPFESAFSLSTFASEMFDLHSSAALAALNGMRDMGVPWTMDLDAFGLSGLFEGLLPTIQGGRTSGHPSNLRVLDLDDDEIERLRDIASEDGTPFAYSVDAETVLELLGASTTAERRSIIGDRRAQIEDHCESVLASMSAEATVAYTPHLFRQIQALRSGQHEGPQSFLTSVLDKIRKQNVLKVLRTAERRHRSGKLLPTDQASMCLVVPALARAFDSYDPDGPRAGKVFYNRHATAHGQDLDLQFTTTNATIALMMVTSLLCYIDAEVTAPALAPA